MEQLPDYMKICYLSLFNTTNEMAYHILKQQGINVLPYLTKQVSKITIFSQFPSFIFETESIFKFGRFNLQKVLIS